MFVVESGGAVPKGWTKCEIGPDIDFKLDKLESFYFSRWEPIFFDLMVVAGGVEFCDKFKTRAVHKWCREFELSIPVHNPERWTNTEVSNTLQELLEFLTGDKWQLAFRSRKIPIVSPPQQQLILDIDAEAVIPFSNGLDSYAVAGLQELKLGKRLIKVRLKPKGGSRDRDGKPIPFTAVPYRVNRNGRRYSESSARSRGFRFALISGIAAFLSNAKRVIVPESGQGIFGPILISVGQAYEDYRCNPLFTTRVEKLFLVLLNFRIKYEYPQIWKTKGETLKEFFQKVGNQDKAWEQTRSCWQQNRQVSVDKKYRQCGVCAACMLRRLSIHSSGSAEVSTKYGWQFLSARDFFDGGDQGLKTEMKTSSMREYAIAGTLYLNDLSQLLDSELHEPMLDMRVSQLVQPMDLGHSVIQHKLYRLLAQHKVEWEGFMDHLGSDSFVVNWARQNQS